MPQAVTHVLIALIVASFIRDFYTSKFSQNKNFDSAQKSDNKKISDINKKDKKKFPLHYVLIAGVAGLLPDLDIIAFWVLNSFGFLLNEVHRTFTHTLFVPLLFLIIAGLTWKFKNKELGKHHLTIHMIFLILALGSFIHILLDVSIAGTIRPFYPFSSFALGFNVANYLPLQLQNLFFPSLDAVLLVLWLMYIEYRHKISDFI